MKFLKPFRLVSSLMFLAALVFSGAIVRAADAPADTTTNAASTNAVRPNTAVIPALFPGFRARHTNFVNEISRRNGDVDILFMGDSITDWWRMNPTNGGKAVFEKYFGDWKVLNLGIAGDTTQGVLWRLQNGEGQGYKPKAVMLMIGTNNNGFGNRSGNTADEIAEGVEAVVAEIRKDFPDAKILLLGIFPRGNAADPLRAKIKNINEQISKLGGHDNVTYMDIGSKFLDAGGNFLPGVFRNDRLHPTAGGYQIWADAVHDTLGQLAGK